MRASAMLSPGSASSLSQEVTSRISGRVQSRRACPLRPELRGPRAPCRSRSTACACGRARRTATTAARPTRCARRCLRPRRRCGEPRIPRFETYARRRLRRRSRVALGRLELLDDRVGEVEHLLSGPKVQRESVGEGAREVLREGEHVVESSPHASRRSPDLRLPPHRRDPRPFRSAARARWATSVSWYSSRNT